MSQFKGKKILVIGLGTSGLSACHYFTQMGAKVTATDMKTKQELGEAMKNLGELKIELELGKHNPKSFTTFDLIFLSPGVPTNIEGLSEVRAAGIPITNDIEIFSQLTQLPIIAVTGTNGKTTTATLIADMLKNDGKKVFLAGNIGRPVFDMFLKNETADVCVLEVSSFQCESLDKFKPGIAVFTNLEPNHLDRYTTGLDAYYDAKKRLIKNADSATTLVTNLDNLKASELAQGFPGKVLGFTRRNPIQADPSVAETFQGAYIQKPKMILKLNGSTTGADDEHNLMLCRLPGDHNRENILAAACAAKAFGCSKTAIQKTIDTFKGVPHRLEFIRKKDNVYFYNDSKSTSVAALIRALSSFSAPLILIAGGKDKDQDFTPLAELVKKRVKNLILVGEAKEKMNRFIGDFSETFLVGTFEEAILLAYQKSRNGDVILLSPACASYDMFKNYEERGEYFKKLVAQL